MKKKLLGLTIVLAGLAFGACSEDATMDELIQDTEMTTDPEEEEKEKDKPFGG